MRRPTWSSIAGTLPLFVLSACVFSVEIEHAGGSQEPSLPDVGPDGSTPDSSDTSPDTFTGDPTVELIDPPDPSEILVVSSSDSLELSFAAGGCQAPDCAVECALGPSSEPPAFAPCSSPFSSPAADLPEGSLRFEVRLKNADDEVLDSQEHTFLFARPITASLSHLTPPPESHPFMHVIYVDVLCDRPDCAVTCDTSSGFSLDCSQPRTSVTLPGIDQAFVTVQGCVTLPGIPPDTEEEHCSPAITYELERTPLSWQSVAPGGDLTCGLTDQEGLICFDDFDDHLSMELIHIDEADLFHRFRSISASPFHRCAVTDGGDFFCWGQNDHGQAYFDDLEETTIESPRRALPASTNWQAAATGRSHTCGLSPGGQLFCFGSHLQGQLGIGGTLSAARPPTRIFVPDEAGGTSWRAIDAGGDTTCAITNADELFCWGALPGGDQSTPLAVDFPHPQVDRVTVGTHHICAAPPGNQPTYCWGEGGDGRLGTGGTSLEADPTAVTDLPWGTRTSAGDAHTCGVTPAGLLLCWGDGSAGQLGDGTSGPGHSALLPRSIGSPYQSVFAGDEHTCAISSTGSLLCWGRSTHLEPTPIEPP